jgi:hypothetical protein
MLGRLFEHEFRCAPVRDARAGRLAWATRRAHTLAPLRAVPIRRCAEAQARFAVAALRESEKRRT